MSCACPPPFICVGLLVSSRRIVAPLAQCLSGRFPSLVRVSLLRRGVSPGVGSVGALGELRWLHLYHLTPDLCGLLLFAGCLGCSGRCFLFTVRHSARIHGDHLVSFTDSCVSLARHPVWGCSLDTCIACDWLALLSSSMLFQDSVICADFWSRQYGPHTACERLR